MKALIAAALTTVLGTPAFAQDARITQAVNVLASVETDQAKRANYCEMQALLTRAEQARGLAEIGAANDPNSEDAGNDFVAWEALE